MINKLGEVKSLPKRIWSGISFYISEEKILKGCIQFELRKITKAMILGSVLTQSLNAENKRHLTRAKKILQILTQDNFQFLLRNYQ